MDTAYTTYLEQISLYLLFCLFLLRCVTLRR